MIAIGSAEAPPEPLPTPDDVAALDADPVRCLDPTASAAMVAAIDEAHKDGDTLGGVVEVIAYGAATGPRARTSTGTGASTRGWPVR